MNERPRGQASVMYGLMRYAMVELVDAELEPRRVRNGQHYYYFLKQVFSGRVDDVVMVFIEVANQYVPVILVSRLKRR